MSGGNFDYDQYRISNIADSIQSELDKMGSIREDYYPGDNSHYHHVYPADIVDKFKEAIKLLRTAAIYAHRIDYLICGDDSEETFRKRLSEDLEKLELEI